LQSINRLFAVLVLAFAATTALAESFEISDIRLEGLQRVSASPVFAAMPVRVGDVVDSEDIRGVIRSLFATGFFTNVQVARDGDVFIVILKERPAIKSIKIDGNKAIKTEQLMEIMTDNGLSEGEILQRHTLQGITRELERQYISQARYGASVDVEVEELPNSLVNINMDVEEGSAAKIRHLNYVGNEIYSDKQLLDLFELAPGKWYTLFSSKDKYAREKLTGDIETLESFYLDRGYLDFTITSTQVSISADKKAVFITLNLSEGEKYTVSKVDLAGDPIMSEAVVKRLFLLKVGNTFSQARMKGTSEYITTLLGNAGYTNASVEGIPKKNQQDNTVEITFFVDPGKRVYVRRIEFSGNTKTSDEVLRREMRQLEGASASDSSIENSKIRLERLGHFKGVTVETEDVPGYDDLIDVKYDVEEQPSGSIQASVGYSEAYDLNLGMSVSENNWLGTGKQVQFSINHNRFQNSYSLNYNDPYFTPDGVSRGFSAFFRSTDYGNATFAAPYSTDAAGLSVNFGYPISEISYLSFGVGFTNQELKIGSLATQQIRRSPYFFGAESNDFSYITQSEYELRNAGGQFSLPTVGGVPQEYSAETFAITDDVIIDNEPGFVDKYGTEFNSASLSMTWNRSTLNRGILATRGNKQTLSLETTAPGSDLQYYKLVFDAQMFKPITSNTTLRLRTKLGYGDGYGEMDVLPFFENFRSGGIGSIRGYEPYTLGPLDVAARTYVTAINGAQDVNNDGFIFLDERFINNEVTGRSYVLCEDPGSGAFSGCETGKLVSQSLQQRIRPNGGNVLMEFSAELLLPIPFAKDTRSMQLLAFYDAGNVFSTYCRDDQLNCFGVDLNELRSSVGIGFKWLSGFGPLTFSYAQPLKREAFDQAKGFQFSFGAGF
jgi:outer membrane protein insertion porin family